MGILKKIITRFYGLRMKLSKLTGMGIGISTNNKQATPPENFYNLEAKANNGAVVGFEKFKGKKVLIVNLASQCGFTPQYNELE